MAESLATPSPTSTSTLQRGKACLRCRKRKMRCDGAKPACQQCVRAKKPDGCQYDDGKGKTRTQILREHIERLEQRIRELEDPEFTSPSVTLYDPHAHHRTGSSSSSVAGSPGSAVLSASHSPYPSAHNSPQGSWIQGIPSPSPTPFKDVYTEEPQPSASLAQMLVDIFTPHRYQCYSSIHLGRLKESFTRPPMEQRHPVLTNAVFLWACYVSRPGLLSQHESQYLARTLDSLSDALRYKDKILDVIQASCLLSMYFLSNGRVTEGGYHANAAATLALQCGLNGAVMNMSGDDDVNLVDSLYLGLPKDAIEQGERILTFWQVFNLDRCWSVVLHKPLVIQDGQDRQTSILVPWPQQMSEYESGQIDETRNFQTIRNFFDGQASNLVGGFSVYAMRVKASALFERAHSLSLNWDHRLALSSVFADDFQNLDQTIARFQSTLIPIHQLDANILDEKHAFIAIHTLTHAAVIHLYFSFGHDDPISYEKCLRAARSCVSVVKHISDTDYEYLDPILGPCWTCAADTLVRDLNALESSWPMIDNTDIRNDISTLMYAMNNLSTRFPISGLSLAKLQKRLAGL